MSEKMSTNTARGLYIAMFIIAVVIAAAVCGAVGIL